MAIILKSHNFSKVLVALFALIPTAACQLNTTSLTFQGVEPLVFDISQTVNITMDFSCFGITHCNSLALDFTFTVEKSGIAAITGNATEDYKANLLLWNATNEEMRIENLSVPVRGKFLGKTTFRATLGDTNWIYEVHVKRVQTFVDLAFQGNFV